MNYLEYLQYYFIRYFVFFNLQLFEFEIIIIFFQTKTRCLSIQHLYSDMNSANPTNQVPVNVVASAFAKATYGGNTTQFLGDVTVNNNAFMFPSSNGTVPGKIKMNL